MNLVYIGDLVNTHGLKGEVRILSNFEQKDKIFKTGNQLRIFNSDLEITSYRVHKNYDMVTFKGIETIEDVLMYKGEKVYIDRDLYDIGFIVSDLVGFEVYTEDKFIGKVDSIMESPKNYILVIIDNNKRHLVPYVDEFVKDIDIENKKLTIDVIEGLINED